MSNDPIIVAVMVITTVLMSMTLHEAMHAYASYWLGDDTAKHHGRLTLNPLSHIDPIYTVLLPTILALAGMPIFGAAKPVPFNPARLKYDEFGAALVALAGPVTNFLLAIVASVIVRVWGATSGLGVDFLVTFVIVNIGFFVFNMIPFPPLDGSRVLYAVAPEPVQDVMRRIESFGVAGILVLLFVLFPVISPFLSNINSSILTFLLG